MIIARTLLLIGLLVLGMANLAHAGTLITSTLSASTGFTFVCQAVNVSGQPRTITVELMGAYDGSVVAGPSSCETLPGTIVGAGFSCTAGASLTVPASTTATY